MSPDKAGNDPVVELSLKRFLTLTYCPAAWRRHDLYLIRDDEVVFYAGQSHHAFERVWDHLRDGFKGGSTVGRFILNNWPCALNFTVELLHSQWDRFGCVGNDRNAAERQLIERYSPCFNAALNDDPTPLPERYALPGVASRHPRSLRRMVHDAEKALRRDGEG